MKIILFGDYHYISDHNYNKDLECYDYNDYFRDMKREFNEFAIGEIFKEEADYYISLGDLTNVGLKDEVEGIYKFIENTGKLDRFIHVFGNHDLYTNTTEELAAMTNQKYNYSIDTQLAKLIMLSSGREKDPVNWGGYLSDEVLSFVEEEIKNAEDKPVIVFSHHPVQDTVMRSNYLNHYIESDRNIWDVFNKNVRLFIAGHTHCESIRTIENLSFVNLDAFLDHPKYSVMNITEDEIDIKSVEIELPEKIEEYRKKIGSNMPHFRFTMTGKGTTHDRELNIQLKK
ncbi:MAG: metallophosphoesterase [Peptoniphilus sp.]|nr:metallophosphoesterase [Peptoniphilus sp.]